MDPDVHRDDVPGAAGKIKSWLYALLNTPSTLFHTPALSSRSTGGSKACGMFW